MSAAGVITERTRLETLQEQEVKLAEQVEQLREKIATNPERIAKERESAWYAKPSKRPLAQLNSPLQKLLDAEKADAATLNGLQQDLSAVRNVIQQEDVRVREQETAEAREKLELLHEKEEDVWMKAGKLLGELSTVWNSYVAQVEQSHQFASVNGFESSDARAVIPGPGSFKEFLALLLTAATEETVRSEPHTAEIVDYGIYGRRDENGADLGGAMYETRVVGTRTVDTRRRLDERDILFRAIPDLRSAVRTPKG
jgi:chaperonin cofactor prefoldin